MATKSKHPAQYNLIARQLPARMKTASTTTLDQLRTALRDAPATLGAACRQHPEVAAALAREHEHYRASTQAARTLFANLPDLDAFATQQLSAAIKQRFDLQLDVNTTYLFDAVGYARQRQSGAAEPSQFSRSLKHHALQNFERSATEAGGMDVQTPHMRSVILDAHGYGNGPPFDNFIAIDPTDFAALSRKLDIGGQYQALIDNIYYPSPETPPGLEAAWPDRFAIQAPVLETLGQVELSSFKQSLHCAFLLGQIGKAAYDAIQATALETVERLSSSVARFSFLTLWQIELTGLVLIQFQSLPCVVLYSPRAAEPSLQEYPSLDALNTHLRDAAQKDLTVITRHVPDAHKTRLLGKLQDRLTPLTFTLKNTYERVPDPEAQLPLKTRAFERQRGLAAPTGPPREWQTLQLFRRLGYRAAPFDDQDAIRILDVSGTDATLRIWEAEDGEDFITFAGQAPFWSDYLREVYADAFAQIESKFQHAVNNLQYDQPQASLDELEAPTRALQAQRDKQIENLIAELTFRIRADHR